ncbi:MAG: HD domain-containing protein, partial [Acidobacteriota bacterium]
AARVRTRSARDHRTADGLLSSLFVERPGEGRFDKKDERLLRFAALRHDTGHGPFSHTSEQFYSALPELKELRDNEPMYRECAAGELLSNQIVLSEPFREFVAAINAHFHQALDCDAISRCITGCLAPERMFLSEVVHGPFDADKLDYMHRDGMFSGLQMHVDLDRLFASINIKANTKEGKTTTRLCGSVSGITPLTQIMFNKMILYTGMYHHHKVRAVDCMLWAIFDLAMQKNAKIGGVEISSPVDFLRLTDDYVLIPELTNDEEIKELILRIRTRDLWERALVISRRTVPESMHADTKGDEKKGVFTEYTKFMGNQPEKIRIRREIADEIWELSGKPCKRHEVWLDIPKLPSMDEAKRMWIEAPQQPKPEKLEDFLPISKWVELYGHHQWRSHVFCPREHKKVIADAAEKVIKERFGLELLRLARQYARTPD